MCIGKHGGKARKAESGLSGLDKLSQRLGLTLDLKTEASVLLDWAKEAGLAESVALLLADETKESLNVVAYLGAQPVPCAVVPMGEGFAAALGQVLPADRQDGTTISVPLVIEGEVVGVICARRPASAAISAEEEKLWDATSGIAVAILRNIQRYQSLVQAMAQLAEQKQIERLKDDLILSASHDLRSPITSIKGYAQLAARQLERGEVSQIGHNLEAIVRQVDQLNRLLDALLDVSRIQVGKLDLRCEEVDLNELLDEIVERFAGAAQAHQLRLALPADRVVGRWDRGRIEQAVANLVGNAIKYSPQGGEVVVRVEPAFGEVTVSVEDKGIGVAEDERERLFERFYRSQSALAQGLGGSGLGLYITQGVIQAHGGRIWVESEEGKGSAFRFVLPICAC
ncbi:MAG: hypothetical protein HYX94_04860 [Chloroflexi bacterium]|nr:hypothetical protein [Chloroflexota bacterium]